MNCFSRLLAPACLLALAAPATAQQAPLTFHDTPPPTAQAPATADPAYGQPAQGAAVPATLPAMAPGVGPTDQVAAPAPVGAAPVQPGAVAPPAAPFVLNPQDLQYVQQTLQMWEAESAKVNTFNADFERLEYDKVWGTPDKPMIVSTGTLSYSKPDKGSFKIESIRRWTKTDPKNPAPDAPGEYVEQKDEVGEHWVCDGKSIYEYDHRQKQLRVTSIPAEMQGKSIVDGPLPFLFGAEAQKLMDRYWIRAKTHPAQIWLEAYPRRQIDAANYDFVEVMLDRKTMQPLAIQVHLPGGQQRHVYTFQQPSPKASTRRRRTTALLPRRSRRAVPTSFTSARSRARTPGSCGRTSGPACPTSRSCPVTACSRSRGTTARARPPMARSSPSAASDRIS